MAVADIHVNASPERCFEVLADPRSFSYWVVGSRRIRAADPDWPAVGTAFDHTVGFGPLVTHDHSEVEEMVENRLLCLRVKARPFGTGYVRLELEPENSGTRLRIVEKPGDRVTRALFSTFADKLLHARNLKTLERLKELAEGTVAMPSGTLPDRDSEQANGIRPPGQGAVGSGPRNRAGEFAGGLGRGFVAGLVGAGAMSVSTVVEMRLSGRRPSDVPARALERVLAIRHLNRRAERRLTTLAHLLTGAGVGGARGLLAGFGLRSPYAAPVTFALSLTPDLVIVPALGVAPPPWRWSRRELAISILHHGVFAAAAATTLTKLER